MAENMRTIRKNKPTVSGSSGQFRKMQNFKLAVSLGSNWVDMDTGTTYMIQEYAEALHDPALPKDQKPTKIRMVDTKTGKDKGWADEWIVAEKMKDPEPDPRY